MSVRRIIAIATLVLFSSLLLVLLAWQLSPLNRLLAWSQLKNNTYSSTEEALNLALVLAGHSNTTKLPELAKELQKFDIGAVDTLLSTSEQPVPFTSSRVTDENFIADKTYSFPTGLDGIYKRNYHQITLNEAVLSEYSVPAEVTKEPINEVIHAGTKSAETLTKELNDNWNSFKSELLKKNKEALTQLLSSDEKKTVDALVQISDLSYRLDAKATIHINDKIEEHEDSISVATVTIKQTNCDITGVLPILYDKNSKKYLFDKALSTVTSLCSKPQLYTSSSTVITLSCKNCWLAPVSKSYALPSWYAPSVVGTGLNGGGFVTADTKAALQKMFTDAAAKGVSYLRVSSSYRSFKTQETLFNTYVNNELKLGLTYAKAVEKANTYSAKPGQSEHQLGTTLDLMGCPSPCNFYSSANDALYTYLRSHAHEFGFVISYPSGSQPYTGYTYEPWHVRYIGVDHATALFNLGYLSKKGYYLNQYLVDRKLW